MPQSTDAPAGPQPPEQFHEPFARDDGTTNLTRRAAGHLLRRLEFGATPARLDALTGMPIEQAVADVFDFDPASDVGGLNAFMDQAQALFNTFESPDNAARWWAHRMVHTPKPLHERVALMWHDHFATSAAKVRRADWMHDQIELFRTAGLGSFRDLVVAVGRGCAMLRWLDGHDSHKDNPNENYGREVMELFCLGVGEYTEDDVKEAARAFTGWQTANRTGRFGRDRFDDGDKTLFSGTSHEQRGPFDDEAAVDAILKHPAAAGFIARRLLRVFVHPQPRDEHVAHYAGRLLHHNWHVGNTLREIVGSRLMMSRWAYRSRFKSPVELVIGACHNLQSRPRARYVYEAFERMGQKFLYPPDVSGWKGDDAWVNSTTVIERFRFCRFLGEQGGNNFIGNGPRDVVASRNLATATAVVDGFSNILLDGEVEPAVRGRLLDYLSRDRENKPAEFKSDDRTGREKIDGLVQLLASSPAYQLA